MLKGQNECELSPIREYTASVILDSFNINHVRYLLTQYKGITYTKCKCMSNNKISIVTAYDMLQSYGFDYLSFIEFVKDNFLDDFSKMCVADYILCNTDRHEQNWGFYVDNSNMRIISLHPLFDHDNSLINGIDENVDTALFEGRSLLEVSDEFMSTANLILIKPLYLSLFDFDRSLIEPFMKRLDHLGIKYKFKNNILYPV